jgi:hypothetical protein
MTPLICYLYLVISHTHYFFFLSTICDDAAQLFTMTFYELLLKSGLSKTVEKCFNGAKEAMKGRKGADFIYKQREVISQQCIKVATNATTDVSHDRTKLITRVPPLTKGMEQLMTPTPHFRGREEEVRSVLDCIADQETCAHGTNNFTCIVGNSSIGKSAVG